MKRIDEKKETQMKKTILTLLPVILLGACDGYVASPETEIATFTLRTQPNFDPLGGLFSVECMEQYGGPSHCTPYPNSLECDVLTVAVKADGRTYAECRVGTKLARRGFMGLAEGVPFLCKASQDLSCQSCVDLYGNAALDTCHREVQSWRSTGSDWQSNLPPGTGFIAEPGGGTGQTPSTPPAGGIDACDWRSSIGLYAGALNKLLKHEGLNFTWSPDATKFVQPASTALAGNKNASCSSFIADLKSMLLQCPKPGPNGECSYCWNVGGVRTCKCYRINVAALESACQTIPQDCDHAEWSAGLVMAYGAATKWLFSPSYPAFYGQAAVAVGDAPKFPRCEGSPLVLDLGGDGIEPTSSAAGARFDLLGVGAIQTSWVKGDDALLALDRDGNGRIESGLELFGEATPGGHADGFAALGSLDSNGDGVIDARDARFGELRLWNDRNGDGISQPAELVPLGRKVRSLGLGRVVNPAAVDRFGNDLTLQGKFTRLDGSSGLMVDVFFVGR
jgi:hypothetical protein